MSIEDWKITRIVVDGLGQFAPGVELAAAELTHDKQWVRDKDPDTGEVIWCFTGPSWSGTRDIEIVVFGPKSESLQLFVHAEDGRGRYVIGINAIPGPGSRRFELRGPGHFMITVGIEERLAVAKGDAPCKG